MKVKDPNTAAAKWSTNANAATPAYTAGVKAPKTDWATATAGAEQNWSAGVSTAAANGSFAKGVTAAGTSKWQNGASTKGAQRYGPGVSQAQPNYVQGVTPYFQALGSLTLPPRLPKGNPGNLQRVQAVDQALSALKTAGGK